MTGVKEEIRWCSIYRDKVRGKSRRRRLGWMDVLTKHRTFWQEIAVHFLCEINNWRCFFHPWLFHNLNRAFMIVTMTTKVWYACCGYAPTGRIIVTMTTKVIPLGLSSGLYLRVGRSDLCILSSWGTCWIQPKWRKHYIAAKADQNALTDLACFTNSQKENNTLGHWGGTKNTMNVIKT